jgi:uncharacterized protein
MFDSPFKLVLGLVTGIAFGFLLQKGGVAKHWVMVGQLLLRDFTAVKIMLTAVAVGAVGFWSLAAMGATAVDVQPTDMGGVLFGALAFGFGMAVLGYCPGTTVAAAGQGSRDALAGLLGMLCGALVFVWGFAAFQDVRALIAELGRVTLPALTHTPPIMWVVLLGALVLGMYGRSRHARRSH